MPRKSATVVAEKTEAPKIDASEIHVRIKGLEPGLMPNSLNGYGNDEVPKEIKAKGVKDLKQWYAIDKPAAGMWAAYRGAYMLPTDNTWDAATGRWTKNEGMYIPRNVLWSCFILGCRDFKVKIGSSRKSAAVIMPIVFNIKETAIPLFDKDRRPIKEFTGRYDDHVKVPPRTGARVPKTWGIIYPWWAEFTLKINQAASADTLKLAKEIFDYAGTYLGIMDGRPGLRRGFSNGQFKVETWNGDTV